MGFQPSQPDYNGSGVAIWKARDKNNKEFMKVKILGNCIVNCFQVEKKEE